MNDVLKTAMEVAGRKRPILHQPIALGKLIGTLAGVLPTPPLSADAIDFIASPAVADTANLERVLSPTADAAARGAEDVPGVREGGSIAAWGARPLSS